MSSTQTTTFDPALYSNAENEFLLTNIGKPPVVALKVVPQGVNPDAVKPVITQVYELIEDEKHGGTQWSGIAAVQAAITAYLTQSARWQTDRRKGAKRFPSMFSYDSRKRAFRSGPGSDSGQIRTYFNEAGQRVPFAVDLIPDSSEQWAPDWEVPRENEGGLILNADAHRIECPVCQHTESFKADSRSSQAAARARMSKHLRAATDETDRHRELHTAEFGSPNN